MQAGALVKFLAHMNERSWCPFRLRGSRSRHSTMPKRLEVSLVDGLALKVVAMEMGYRMSESVAALDHV